MNESCTPPFPHQRESSGWTVPFSFEKAIYWASVCFYKKNGELLLEKLLKQRYMENNTFKTHMMYIDYPMNSLNLKEMEELVVNLGDVVIVDCQGMDYICSSGLRVFLSLYKMLA